ncbi:protein LOL2-like [Iris pallida]|uniref:Protein LOL2-like n=1 Tax=Iris pallida TaxID=29817 RepID=A0AAX6I7P1_IRIPA|nr:protein LOL2-like [Iris pallida]
MMQSQVVCSGCRSVLAYPRGATNVRCSICAAITTVPPPGMDMAQLVCGHCRSLLYYTRGAASVRCSCCNTMNLARSANQVAHVNCAQCHTTLMYPYGAPSVKCAICRYVTNVGMGSMMVPVPVIRPNGTTTGGAPSAPARPHSSSQTVVVENPMSVNSSGKLVSNVVVGVTAEKK